MIFPLWFIRPADEEGFDPTEIYANEPSLFSIEIHHGGEFTELPGRKYVSGIVSYVDNIDDDQFSVHDIDSIVEKLDYLGDETMYYHYRIPGQDLDVGLRALGNDSDVIMMLQCVHTFKIIEVYIEHGCTKLNTYLQPPKFGPGVVIEEINDEGPSTNIKQLNKVGPSTNRKQFQLPWYEEENQFVNEELYQPEAVNIVADGANANVNANKDDIDQWLDDNDMQSDDIFLSNFIDQYDEEVEDDAENQDETDDEQHNEEHVESESDSDYIIDEENSDKLLEEVEVDMAEFKAAVDMNEEEMLGDDEIESDDCAEIEVDNFDSATDEENDPPLKKTIRRVNRKNRNWKSSGSSPFYVGQTFSNKEEVKTIVKRLAVETRRQLVIGKNDKVRLRVVCYGINPSSICTGGEFGGSTNAQVAGSDKLHMGGSKKTQVGGSRGGQESLKEKASNGVGKSALNNPPKKRFPIPTCPWTLHISRPTQDVSWVVKTVQGVHKCLQTRKVRLYTISQIAKEIESQIEANPTIPLKALQDLLQKKNQVQISYQKTFRAKIMAVKKMHGDYKSQYALLRDYCEELLRSNPGSTIKIDVERECNPDKNTRQFRRIYICLAAVKAGFKACGRDLLGLDGCFMKGPYPGQILTAVGLDSNNGIYPVAYAVVEAETTNSWSWFLDLLGDDLDLTANSKFTFVSDRQKGIIPALKKIFPEADHRYCLRHIHENMKTGDWKGDMYKDLLWDCASATTIPQFERRMETIRKQDAKLYDWLKAIPAKHWSRSHFTDYAQSDILLNNLCEVFNKQLVGGRDKPIISCLEYIREYMLRRIVKVHVLIAKNEGPLTPSATKTFNLIKTLAAEYTVIMAGIKKYQITGPWQDQVCVDLDKRTCSCRRWEITGMPCKHAVACIWDLATHEKQGIIPETWVSKVYWHETWKKAYLHTIEPINGVPMWRPSRCPTILTAPKHHTPVGRPKKKRKKSAVELSEAKLNNNGKMARKGFFVKCSQCKGIGHNKRTCKGQGSSQPVSQTAPAASQGATQ